MAATTKRLGVWLHGRHVADLEQTRWPRLRLRYTAEALDAWELNTPVISCSLPLAEGTMDPVPFLKGLLPEGRALQAMAARAKLPVNRTFDLLARYGRDVAGALVISPEEPEPRKFAVERYTDEGLANAIGELDEYPLGVHDDSELSLAGLQDKLLLVKGEDGTWGRPLHGRPSTHILKIDDRRFPGLVEAEAMCMKLARAAGLTSVSVSFEHIGHLPCLIVSRFDRSNDTGSLERVHQEDLCQATGVDPEDQRGKAKYQYAGGPSFLDAARLLNSWAKNADRELDQLVMAMTFTTLIGNADAHGKNLALLHPKPGEIALAPLYDTVPTALWSPPLKTRAAMSIGAQVELPDVTTEDLLREAKQWGVPEDRARSLISTTVSRVTESIQSEIIPSTSKVAMLVADRVTALGRTKSGLLS